MTHNSHNPAEPHNVAPSATDGKKPNLRQGGLVARRRQVSLLAALAFVVIFGSFGVRLILKSYAASLANTNIAIAGDGGSRTFDGIGAVLGGGGVARYLLDYPATQRSQILDYLFKPNFGASFQMLKLEIGGDANSTDGSEPSIEHVKGQVNCNAGYELAIAQQAMAINPDIKLYGLQWAAPGWVDDGTASIFTNDDISYLMSWLGCAKQDGLTVSYLGGWNESDNGTNAAWFHSLRIALNANGYKNVQIVAGDSGPGGGTGNGDHPDSAYQYIDSPDVSILGVHDVCGLPTGSAGANTQCYAGAAARDSNKPLWGSEMGGVDAGAQAGCSTPCAGAMDRAFTRGYIDARLTGYLEWPALTAMPSGLNYENRGSIFADQPWSGNYSVNAMTWATAQFTQFIQPGWTYVNSGSGYLQNNRADGSYVTLVDSTRNQWTTVVETTAGVSKAQQATFTISGGNNLSTKAVHVWSSNFDFSNDSPSQWFKHEADITPVNGSFEYMIQPGYVYTFTTTTGQSKGSEASIPAASSLGLPYNNALADSGNAGSMDDEPSLLAAMQGAFELKPCSVVDGANTTCTEQTAVATPLLWHPSPGPTLYPYAILGNTSWKNYTTSADILFTKANSSGGVIGRVSGILQGRNGSRFNGYVLDMNDQGTWKLSNNSTTSDIITLATGHLALPPGVNTWHRLSLSMAGTAITASIDGTALTALSDGAHASGLTGLEGGASSLNWPQVEYSNLSVTQN